MPGATRVLVADAKEGRRATLASAILDEGVEAVLAVTAAEAEFHLAPPNPFAAAIVALDLPGGDGIALIARLGASGLRIPLLLTANQPEDHIVVRALDAGASDVLAAPFRPALLRGRLRAALRGPAAEETEFAIGPYRFDTESRMLHDPYRNLQTRLTEKEAALLRYLHRAGNRAVAREELLREVWGYSPLATTHTVATHIHRLRRKLEAAGPGLFATEERGYRLVPPPPTLAPPTLAPPTLAPPFHAPPPSAPAAAE